MSTLTNSRINFVQDENYKINCHLTYSDDVGEKVHLWKVEVDNYGTETFFVLAADEKSAISQATTHYSWDLARELEKNFSKAEKIPFRVRGWGKQEF